MKLIYERLGTKKTVKNKIKIYFKKTLLYGPPGGGGESTFPPLFPFLGAADTNATKRAIVNNFKFI
jgi:hypothetical protein